MATKELSAPPSLPLLYATSLIPGLPSWAGGSTPSGLPDLEVTLKDFTVDAHELASYDRVCGLRLTDDLPITYLHVLAFPLSMQLMTDKTFPYPLIGLVHLANRMSLHRPVAVGEKLSFRVRTDRLRTHKKGMLFDVLAEARVGDELVWEGESSYLRPGKPSEKHVAADLPDSLPGDTVPGDLEPPADSPAVIWSVPSDIGRRYGAVSGDVNPIHLHPWAAKAFGFPRHIGHGMWSHAKAMAGFEGRLPSAYQTDVRFLKPVLLPTTVAFTTFRFTPRGAGGGKDVDAFTVRGTSKNTPHLAGTITPL
jgi:acyl dehydratase